MHFGMRRRGTARLSSTDNLESSRAKRKAKQSEYSQKALRSNSRNHSKEIDEEELLNEIFANPIKLPQVYRSENGTYVIEGQEPKLRKPVVMTPNQIEEMTTRMSKPKQYIVKVEEVPEISRLPNSDKRNESKAQFIDSTIGDSPSAVSFYEFEMLLRSFGIISYSLEERPHMLETFIELCGIIDEEEKPEEDQDEEMKFDTEKLKQVLHDATDGTKPGRFYREIESCVTFTFRNSDRSKFRKPPQETKVEPDYISEANDTETEVETDPASEEVEHASSMSYDADEIPEVTESAPASFTETSIRKRKAKNNFPMFYDDISFQEEQRTPSKKKGPTGSSISRAHASSYINSNTSVSGYEKTVMRMRKNQK